MRSVLFVCTANICRSPMAEALWRDRVSRAGKAAEWKIESAGTWAFEDDPISPRAFAVLSIRGLDAARHRSRVVNRNLLKSFQLILVMEQGHKEALQAEFPELADRIYLLSEMIGRIYDIRDPYGSSMADYEDTARELEKILARGEDQITHLAEEPV